LAGRTELCRINDQVIALKGKFCRFEWRTKKQYPVTNLGGNSNECANLAWVNEYSDGT
jgi:hypothetical protein